MSSQAPARSRHPLVELTLMRSREFAREPEAMFWVFLFPVLLALSLGFAFQEKGPEKIPVGVVGAKPNGMVERALRGSPGLKVRAYDDRSGREALRAGKISLLVEEGREPVLRFDPNRPESRIARLEVVDAIERGAGRRDPLPLKEVRMNEKGARYIDFLIPGLLGMNLMSTSMWSLGFSIVTARMRKLLKRFVATPMKKSDYLLAQIISRLLFLVAEVVILLVFSWLVFDVTVKGSILLLAITCLTGAMAFAGIGLLVASRARTIEAVSGLMNFVMLPMWLLSGVFFSAERFPDPVQPVIRLLPLTALNEALRAIMNQGATISTVAMQLILLAAWGAISFVVALRIFQWK